MNTTYAQLSDRKFTAVRRGTRYFVDGTNVSYWGRNDGRPPSLIPLLALLTELLRCGDTFFCFFDATTRYRLEMRSEYERGVYEYLTERYRRFFDEVPGGTTADEFFLRHATATGGAIITNDRFKQYLDKYRWLQTQPERLIKGTVMAEYLTVPRLDIHLQVHKDLLPALWDIDEQINKKLSMAA